MRDPLNSPYAEDCEKFLPKMYQNVQQDTSTFSTFSTAMCIYNSYINMEIDNIWNGNQFNYILTNCCAVYNNFFYFRYFI